ncbi:MAG: sigma-70 family RNA polymerase sigma factor [Verrucomicrobiota bacterium]
MKTTLERNRLTSRTGLRLARLQLVPSPRSKRLHAPARLASPVETSLSPAAAEFVPAESLRGDTLQLYLREIGQVKLLTPPEEIALARRVQRGDKKAREHMITANLRLVVKIARGYEGLGLPLLDLINEGNIGLMKGVQRFKLGKGAKFSTYASLWIKQAIRRALSNTSKTIRLPVHVVDRLTHMRRAEVKLREILDREPTDDEVADELGIDARRVRRYRDASRVPVSLDSPVSDDDATSISEHVADANAAAPFAAIVQHNDRELVKEVLATLDARESRILAMRFGLDNGRPKTLEEVGARLGVTRERIRQIQEQALQKMRVKIENRD